MCCGDQLNPPPKQLVFFTAINGSFAYLRRGYYVEQRKLGKYGYLIKWLLHIYLPTDRLSFGSHKR